MVGPRCQERLAARFVDSPRSHVGQFGQFLLAVPFELMRG
jgi:hypothetical protein